MLLSGEIENSELHSQADDSQGVRSFT